MPQPDEHDNFNLKNKKFHRIKSKRPHFKLSTRPKISDSETKGGGVNDIGFESNSEINNLKNPPNSKENTVETQTDDVDPDWAKETYPPIEVIELDSLRIVSVVPRNIQDPYYKNGTGPIKKKKCHCNCKSAQTQIKMREFYPNFKSEGIPLADVPYVRSKDWSNNWSNEYNSKELDSEWLSLIQLENTPPVGKINVGESCAKEVYSSWKLYVNIMRCLGRWPFLRQINSEGYFEFSLRKSSFEFMTFVVTSCCYFFILTLKFISIIAFFLDYRNSSTPDHQITTLEFDKYWPYLFWNICLATFIFYWNILLTFNGIFMLEYMNRFSKSVERMKYVPTDGIRIRIWWWLISFILYATILTTLFIYKFEPVYYGSGLTATYIFSNLWTGARFSYYYPTLRLIGFIYHLCLVFNFNSILMHIVIFVKFLENMASKWNIRFAYRFKIIARDKLEFYATKSERTTISSYASLKIETLLQENQIIASLSRHISRVFRNSFNAYIFISGWLISIFIYRATTYILTTSDTEEVFLKKRIPGIVGETGDELYYEDDDFQRTLALILVCCYLSISWFLNSRVVASCGETIMSGFKLVQRYGLIRCKDATERLMIKSLTFQFGPTLNYYLDFGFKFDKTSIFNMSAYIVLFGFGLLSFSPFNLSKQAITACLPDLNSENVVCKTIYVSRVDRVGKEPITSIKSHLSEVVNSSVSKDESKFFEKVKKKSPRKPKKKSNETNYCTPMFNGVLLKNAERIPYACDANGKELKPYGNKNNKDCWDKLSDAEVNITSYSDGSSDLFFCDEKGVEIIYWKDDCGNKRTKRYKNGTNEEVKLVNVLVNISGNLYQMCCYYYGLSPESLSRCNMRNSELAQITCLLGSRGGGSGIIYTQGDRRLPCYQAERDTVVTKVPNLNCNGTYNIVGCDENGTYVPPFPNHVDFCPDPPSNGKPYAYALNRTWVYRCDDKFESFVPFHEHYRDDCGNIPYFTKTLKKSVEMLVNGKNEHFCCYDYLESANGTLNDKQGNGFVQLPKSLAVCHIADPNRRNNVCKNGSITPKKC